MNAELRELRCPNVTIIKPSRMCDMCAAQPMWVDFSRSVIPDRLCKHCFDNLRARMSR